MKLDGLETEIYCEKNAVVNNKSAICRGKRAFIVTGKHGAAASGALDDVTSALDRDGIPYFHFDGVTENPPADDAMKAGQLARDFHADIVIGIGGGSAIDFAKASAAYAENNLAKAEDVFCNDKAEKTGLPVIAVPTTAGTGSEVNQYSILTINNGRNKRTFKSPYSYPVLAFVDYRYTASLPKKYSISCALDALAHSIEAYMSPKANASSEALSMEACRIIWRILFCGEYGDGKLDDGGFTEKQRELLMTASNYAGQAIGHCGTGFPHPLGYNLTMAKGVPHGAACAAFDGEYLRLCETVPAARCRLQRLYSFCGAADGEMIEKIPQKYPLGITLTDNEIEDFVSRTENAANYLNCPYVIDRKDMISLYKKLFQPQ